MIYKRSVGDQSLLTHDIRECSIPDRHFLDPLPICPSGLQRLVIFEKGQVLKLKVLISFYLLVHLFLIAW